MKMDMDLIRKLLIYIQDNIDVDEYQRSEFIKIEGYTKNQIIYHVTLLNDNGYIKASCEIVQDLEICTIRRLTLNGHQFLELIKNDKIWNQLKEKLEKVGLAALPIIFTMIEPYIKQLLGIP